MPTIKYKYPVGTVVYFKATDYVTEKLPCLTCEGEGKVRTFSNKEIKCPQCGGTKSNGTNKRNIEIVKGDVVESISVFIEKGLVHIRYNLIVYGKLEDELFLTEEEVKETFHHEVRGVYGVTGNTMSDKIEN